MGYTHYWRPQKSFTDAQWEDVAQMYEDLLLKFVPSTPISFTIEEQATSAHEILAEKDRVLSNGRIFFNGVGVDAHETVVITKAAESNFEFCKTAHKPYDTLVVALLCAIGSRYPDHLSISSDGDEQDWQEGLQFARETLGYTSIALPFGDEDEDDDDW